MVRVALIGYGYWGPNLARNFHQLPESNFVLCCDQDGARLALAKKMYPHVNTTTNVSEVWNNAHIDAVVIATPVRTHFELAKTALESGKHVLVEKPLTTNSQEAEELIRVATAKKRVLMVGHTFEYNPAVLKVKELIHQGELGQIFYAYSTRVNLGKLQRDLNALWSIAPHDISILLCLFDQMPAEVSARGNSYLKAGVDDVVFVSLLFPNQVSAYVHASWLDPSKIRRMTIVGSKRMVVYDDVESEGKVKIYDKGVLKVDHGEIFGEFQYKLHSGDIHIPKIDLTEPLRNECAHFLECVAKGTAPKTDGANGLRVIKVLEAAQRSLEKNGVPTEIR